MITKGCLNISVQWTSVDSDQLRACGLVYYDLTILSSDGATMTNTTMETSLNFSDLLSNNSYNVTVVSRNEAGTGEPSPPMTSSVTGDHLPYPSTYL